jgi:hypothetical protein
MKKIIIISCSIFLLFSCNQEIKEDIPTSRTELLTSLGDEDTSAVETNSKSEAMKPENSGTVTSITETNKTANARMSKNWGEKLLVGRGSEPGWYAEFYNNHLRLLIDNGTDSLHIDHDFSTLNASKNFNLTLRVDHENKTKDIKIDVLTKSCNEAASGEKREKVIIINLDKLLYKGCAGKS